MDVMEYCVLFKVIHNFIQSRKQEGLEHSVGTVISYLRLNYTGQFDYPMANEIYREINNEHV